MNIIGPAARRKVETPSPRFPEGEHEGLVRVKFWVSSRGRVYKKVLLESSGDEALDRAALEALSSWRFKPGSSVVSEARFWFSPDKEPPPRFNELPKPETVRVVKTKPGKAVKKKTKLKVKWKGKLKVLKKVKPQHPGFPCRVSLKAEVSSSKITKVRVLESSGDQEVDRAAVQAVKKWKLKGSGELTVKFTFEVEESQVLEKEGG